jgi:MarR family transcriptional regulator, multiple antibiotic resistance protein MarR
MGDAERNYSAMDVAMAVRHLDLMMAQMHLAMSESLGMSAGELLALAYLSVDGPLGPTELTHRLHMTTGAMTAMLDRLAEHDYVVREPHATDRRRIMVALTKSGRDRIFTQVHGMANEVLAMTEELPAAERDVIGRYLERVGGVISPPAWRP